MPCVLEVLVALLGRGLHRERERRSEERGAAEILREFVVQPQLPKPGLIERLEPLRPVDSQEAVEEIVGVDGHPSTLIALTGGAKDAWRVLTVLVAHEQNLLSRIVVCRDALR
jgi:hypothetical protein